MRLDHLLSTEIAVRVFGQCVPRRRDGRAVSRVLVWKRSCGLHGMGMLLGSRTATPRVFPVVRFVAHALCARPLGGVRGRVARGGLRTG